MLAVTKDIRRPSKHQYTIMMSPHTHTHTVYYNTGYEVKSGSMVVYMPPIHYGKSQCSCPMNLGPDFRRHFKSQFHMLNKDRRTDT